MKVVLAEKPSVARDLARELKATQKRDGYLEGNGWKVTWAYGHMVELKEPDEYDPSLKRWSLEPLPFVPDKFALRPRGDESSQRQLRIVKQLFSEAEEIVCATDAGREGELIFRYILKWTRCTKKPVVRLWISSLTRSAIREGFAQLRPSSDFDKLYLAAKCRSEADWIVGINATRFFTVRYGGRGVLWSTGRVQTPVLAMIVERDLSIAHFKPEDYWELHTQYRGAVFKHTKGKFNKQADAQAVLEKVTGHDLVITDLKEKEEKLQAPLLYDLTALQKDMNARFGMTADEVLQSAQRLYEKKHLTYPRTDSQYLSAEFKQTLPALLQTLKVIHSDEIAPLDLQHLTFTKRVIDDAKVTDHHAIIPTDVLPHSLAGNDQRVYNAVVIRLIAVFYPPCIKHATQVQAQANREPFKVTGRVIVDPGWLVLYYGKEEPKKRQVPEHEQTLPKFEPGERGPHKPEVKQLQTKPPRPFNESSLLQMMETAGKTVDDETLREAMKDKGIGTPATRAAIIELLLERGYIRREKKNLLSTDRGRHLIGLIHDERLKSPELTGEWEYTLKQIEAGQVEPELFMADVIAHVRRLVTEDKVQDGLGSCPLCHAAVIRGRHDYGCSQWKKGCAFVLPSTFHGAQISPTQAKELLRCGISLQPVLLELAGERRFATLRLQAGVLEYNVVEAQDMGEARGTLGTCPLCGGSVIESSKAFGCANWRNGCGFKVWKTIARRKIPKTAVKKLLREGATDVITDFTSNAGKKFDAKLQLVNGNVKFMFEDRKA